MRRKHVQLFEVEAKILTDDVARLRDAVAKRKKPTMVLTAADDDETTDDFTEFFVAYGPVRGANRTDITRFLEHHKITYMLDDTTAVTSLHCGCATTTRSGTDGVVTDVPVTNGATGPGSQWQPGMDW